MTITFNEEALAEHFLHTIKAPTSDDMKRAVVAWTRAESGHSIERNNPWNNRDLVWGDKGRLPTLRGFTLFDNLTDGIEGSVYLLAFYPKTDFRGYAQVVKAARAGNAEDFLDLLAASRWDAGNYGRRSDGTSHLNDIYDAFEGFITDTCEPGPLGSAFDKPKPKPIPKPTTTYIVQTGDTLWDIAESHLGDGRLWPEIAELNKLDNPSLIHPGDRLIIPHKDDVEHEKQPQNTYRVRPGDNLSAIAKHYYDDANDWPRIYKANRSTIGNDPNLIHPGQLLIIP